MLSCRSAFCTDDVVHTDPQVPHGVNDKEALREHRDRLFATAPGMTDEMWRSGDGYLGRRHRDIGSPTQRLRGFDVAITRDGLITYNEAYTRLP